MAITLYERLDADARRFSRYGWCTRMVLAHKGLTARYEPCRFGGKHKFAFGNYDRVLDLFDGLGRSTTACPE